MTHKLLRSISVVALLVLVFWPGLSSASRLLNTTQYDTLIYESWEEYIPQTKCWLYLKSQYYQESLLDPNARSHVGAMGLSQMMPGTIRDIARKLRWNHQVNPYDPETSIEAGAFYMKYLHGQWRSRRTEIDRLRLSWASYNAGLGNLLRAQRKSGGARDWASISSHLHLVTGHHSRETLTYVERIERWYATLLSRNRSCLPPL